MNNTISGDRRGRIGITTNRRGKIGILSLFCPLQVKTLNHKTLCESAVAADIFVEEKSGLNLHRFSGIVKNMSYSSPEDETDVSESELDEYVDRCYEQLKDGSQKVKFSDQLFRCPYCPGKKKLVYPFYDLLQHASDVGKGSSNKGIKHKGKHLGLVRYMKDDLDQEDILSSKFTGLTVEAAPPGSGVNELFVWPWMGILANVDGESISGIKADLAKRGFDPVRVRPLSQGGYAVVEFKRDWSGFYRAIMFEKEYEANNHGKKDYDAVSHFAEELCGWVARADDYNAEGILGEYLQKNGDLTTLGGLETEEKRKTGLLIAQLTNTIDELSARLDKLENNWHEPPSVVHVGSQKDEPH